MTTETIVCIASGASLLLKDIEYVKDKAFVIAINDVYKLTPWADVLYGCDKEWWNVQYTDHFNEINNFKGEKYSLRYNENNVKKLEVGAIYGLEDKWPKLATGKNSGHQAVNLAYHLNAKRIILLGYDMQMTDNKVHFFGKHKQPLRNPDEKLMKLWVKWFTQLVFLLKEKDVKVINCSRESAIPEEVCKRTEIKAIL